MPTKAGRRTTSRENLAACARAGVTLVEQPLPAGGDDVLAQIARPLPICADESVHAQRIARRARRQIRRGQHQARQDRRADRGAGHGATKPSGSASRIMVGCMVATSLAMAPAMLVAQRARVVDLDGPLLLARDRPDGLRYEGSRVHPPRRHYGGDSRPTVRARAGISSPQTAAEPSRTRSRKPSRGRCAVNGKQLLLARRIVLSASLAAAVAALLVAPAVAQAYPNRPVKIVIPFAPGGPTEFIIRLVADRLRLRSGKPSWSKTGRAAPAAPSARSRSPSPSPTATPCCSARPVRW